MKHFTIPTPPNNMQLNPDKRIVNIVVDSLVNKTSGKCPCVPKYLHEGKNQIDYICPCKEAREHNKCLCKLFI